MRVRKGEEMNNIDERTGKPKIILHLCAKMGSDSQPYADAGYDRKIIGIPDYDITKTLIHGDYIYFEGNKSLTLKKNEIYGIIANPVCTMFSLARTRAKTPRDLKEGMILVKECLSIIWECQYDYDIKKYGYKTSLKFWCIENPYGFLNFFLGKPAMIYQPYEFGEVYSKKTCLWGNFNIPPILPLFSKKNLFSLAGHATMTEIKSITALTSSKRVDLRSKCSEKFAKAFFEANQ